VSSNGSRRSALTKSNSILRGDRRSGVLPATAADRLTAVRQWGRAQPRSASRLLTGPSPRVRTTHSLRSSRLVHPPPDSAEARTLAAQSAMERLPHRRRVERTDPQVDHRSADIAYRRASAVDGAAGVLRPPPPGGSEGNSHVLLEGWKVPPFSSIRLSPEVTTFRLLSGTFRCPVAREEAGQSSTLVRSVTTLLAVMSRRAHSIAR